MHVSLSLQACTEGRLVDECRSLTSVRGVSTSHAYQVISRTFVSRLLFDACTLGSLLGVENDGASQHGASAGAARNLGKAVVYCLLTVRRERTWQTTTLLPSCCRIEFCVCFAPYSEAETQHARDYQLAYQNLKVFGSQTQEGPTEISGQELEISFLPTEMFRLICSLWAGGRMPAPPKGNPSEKQRGCHAGGDGQKRFPYKVDG